MYKKVKLLGITYYLYSVRCSNPELQELRGQQIHGAHLLWDSELVFPPATPALPRVWEAD